MRTLHIIPIVHNAADLGSLAAGAQDARMLQWGDEESEAFKVSVHAFWEHLGDAIRRWDVDFQSLILFQDSLPDTGDPAAEIEQKIVEDLAGQGSKNHLILRWLIQQGARLVGTESPDLLIEEYNLAKHQFDSPIDDASNDDAISVRGKDLLFRRDQFIANRVASTLITGEIGLLFIGLVHCVDSKLARDIHVSYPFGKPRFSHAG